MPARQDTPGLQDAALERLRLVEARHDDGELDPVRHLALHNLYHAADRTVEEVREPERERRGERIGLGHAEQARAERDVDRLARAGAADGDRQERRRRGERHDQQRRRRGRRAARSRAAAPSRRARPAPASAPTAAAASAKAATMTAPGPARRACAAPGRSRREPARERQREHERERAGDAEARSTATASRCRANRRPRARPSASSRNTPNKPERALDEHDRKARGRAALAEHIARDDAAHDIAGDRARQVVVVEERDEVELRRARADRAASRAPYAREQRAPALRRRRRR